MSDTFLQIFGVRLDSTLRTVVPLAEMRGAVADAAYASAFSAIQKSQEPAPGADVFAFFAMVCACALVQPEARDEAIERAAAFVPFAGLPVVIKRDVPILIEAYLQRFIVAGWGAAERREALKGLATAYLALAHQIYTTPSVHHIDPAPSLRRVGFAPLIDRLVFGVPHGSEIAVVKPEADVDPTLGEQPQDNTPIATLVDEWLEACGSSASEQSRKSSSVRLFVKAAGLSEDGPARLLGELSEDVGYAFDDLSQAVGTRWGTVTNRLADKTAEEIIAIAGSQPVPKWARHPLSERGRKARLTHAAEFLKYVSEFGISVPQFDWDAVMQEGKR